MVKQKTFKGQWNSDKAEAKYRAKEDILWERVHRQPEQLDVPTDFGSTRVYRWAGSGTPIVFIHGMTDTSVRWIRYAEALEGHDVYAVDIMGDVGRSVQDVGYAGPEDYPVWLGQTLDKLALATPHLVGASLGGYIALAYAMQQDSVSSVVGLDPVGIVDTQLMRLMRWSLRCGIAAFAPEATRQRLAVSMRQPLLADKPAMEVLMQASRGHPIRLPPATTFTDEQLRSISAPVTVLSGADSKAFDVEQLVLRANEILPNGEARLIPDAGHGLSDSHFDDCIEAIRKAIAPTSGARQAHN